MYLSELKLWNFRKYGCDDNIDLKKPHLVVPFKSRLNVLVGENDSGKTAIIDAIKGDKKNSAPTRKGINALLWVFERA